MRTRHAVLITGATGLLGGEVLRRMLQRDAALHAWLLVREPGRWLQALARLHLPASRVTPVIGDVTRPGLGLDRAQRAQLSGDVRCVVHAAADTVFSRPLELSRRTNRDGTAHALELAESLGGVERFVHVSTAFVAGRMTGRIPEAPLDDAAGFVNVYEQSKHEAEAIVRAGALPHVIARSSTIVCESERGVVRQVNAVHRALALQHGGLAALLPGDEHSPVDLVTTSFVAESIARLATAGPSVTGTFQLCAGAGAIALGELLDLAQAVWSRSEAWRRRGVARPALTDLATWQLFQRTVDETADTRLRRVTRSLSHFAPQLALPKRFETERATEATGCVAPAVASYLDRVLETIGTRRGAAEDAAFLAPSA